MGTFHIGSEFYEAIITNEVSTLRNGIAEIESKLFEGWSDSKHETFGDLLGMCTRRAKRSRGYLQGGQDSVSYYVGFLMGLVRAYSTLFQAECEQATIDQYVAKALPNPGGMTRKIFDKLSKLYNHGEWISHGVLAKEVGTTDASLSNIMKRLILSQAVESEKSGRYTNYRLTAAGQRYYEAKLQNQQSSNELELILSRLNSIEENMSTIERRLENTQATRVSNLVDMDKIIELIEVIGKKKKVSGNEEPQNVPVDPMSNTDYCYVKNYTTDIYSKIWRLEA